MKLYESAHLRSNTSIFVANWRPSRLQNAWDGWGQSQGGAATSAAAILPPGDKDGKGGIPGQGNAGALHGRTAGLGRSLRGLSETFLPNLLRPEQTKDIGNINRYFLGQSFRLTAVSF